MPLQFGRDVAARLLSMPERAHWRDCALPKPKEILQADIFKEAFKVRGVKIGEISVDVGAVGVIAIVANVFFVQWSCEVLWAAQGGAARRTMDVRKLWE